MSSLGPAENAALSFRGVGPDRAPATQPGSVLITAAAWRAVSTRRFSGALISTPHDQLKFLFWKRVIY